MPDNHAPFIADDTMRNYDALTRIPHQMQGKDTQGAVTQYGNQAWGAGNDSAHGDYANSMSMGGVGGGIAGLLHEALRNKTEQEKNQTMGRKFMRYAGKGGLGALAGAGAGGLYQAAMKQADDSLLGNTGAVQGLFGPNNAALNAGAFGAGGAGLGALIGALRAGKGDKLRGAMRGGLIGGGAGLGAYGAGALTHAGTYDRVLHHQVPTLAGAGLGAFVGSAAGAGIADGVAGKKKKPADEEDTKAAAMHKVAIGPMTPEKPMTPAGTMFDAVKQQYPLTGSNENIMNNARNRMQSRESLETPYPRSFEKETLSRPLFPHGGVYTAPNVGRLGVSPQTMNPSEAALMQSLPSLPAGQNKAPTLPSPPRGTGAGTPPAPVQLGKRAASLRNFGAKVAAFNIGDLAKHIPEGLKKVMPAAGAGALGGAALGGLHGLISPGHEDVYDDEGNVVGRQRRSRFGAALRGALGGGAAGGLAGGALEAYSPGAMGKAQDWLKSMYKGKQSPEKAPEKLPETNYAKELATAKMIPGSTEHLDATGQQVATSPVMHMGGNMAANGSPARREFTRLNDAFARGETPGSLQAQYAQAMSPEGLEPGTPAPTLTGAEGLLQQQLGRDSHYREMGKRYPSAGGDRAMIDVMNRPQQ